MEDSHGLAPSNGNNGTVLNAPNSYEFTFLKLVHILKLKTSNSLKQLEDLWDSLDPVESESDNSLSKPSRVTPTLSSSSSPTYYNDNSSDSNVSESSNFALKRDSSKMSPDIHNSQPISKKHRHEPIQNPKSNFLNNKIQKSISKTVKASSGESSNDSTSSRPSDELEIRVEFQAMETNIDDMDMSDFTCSICKNFNQETNNKLIECRECTRLFHQQCHQPRIDLEELEPGGGSGDEKQTSWYMSKCNGCRQNKDADEEVSRINSDPPSSKLNPFSSKITSSISKQSSSPVPLNGKVKGLASLANKLSKPPSPEGMAKNIKPLLINPDSKAKSKPNGMIKLGVPLQKKTENKSLTNGKDKKPNVMAKSVLPITRSKVT